MSSPDQQPAPLSVSDLTGAIKEVLETAIPAVRVAGELSNVVLARSGHLYATLKDDAAQIRVVMWKGKASRLRFEPRDGLAVVCEGNVEVYAPRGAYQLILSAIQPEGVGSLELAFRQLQEKLAAEGLFDPSRKRPLPTFPRRLALVTSPTSAAVRDSLQVLSRRWRGTDAVVVPTPVQGAGASEQIAAALNTAGGLPGVDVVLLIRGGGSLEDLWAFNEEPVARAIAACPVPVVSGVGHEIDVTIADLVADRRALTPSEAAELTVPDGREIDGFLLDAADRLPEALRRRVATEAQRLDETADRFAGAARRRLERGTHELERLGGRLHALSPLAVLGRGFSLTRRQSDGQGDTVLTDADAVEVGDEVTTRLARGSIRCEVLERSQAE
ncbi:exodeoxyribonuclease VII large subunit [Alienimonas chondri]|uniref:Exodeoxyribonuclease 7 large subunit n=1 Tax=Alienimonas chondri TaxID=2681879 RepID=A0ABX1VEG6_9PLAN|nr:exodeoxyribonuclease VII large subunit [Alienimonas chondri]NNJ26178.1 Exodeoxyribonuclease 7 large subunit [Alienimonas chondri]